MIDIAVSGLGKLFGAVRVLQNVTFNIYEGQKVALIGKNGSGKSTLFKIIAGELPYEEGSVCVHPSKKAALLSQLPKYPAGTGVRQVLESAFEDLRAMEAELKRLERIMSLGGGVTDILKRYGQLQQRYEAAGGYETETELMKIVLGLRIGREMLDRDFAALSGGEQTMVNLGRILLEKTDIMLLDEPTNHLDMRAVEWLEERILAYKGTVIVVSHDRYFLDRVSTRTIELENCGAEVYEGNYSFYALQKQEELRQRQAKYEQMQREIDRLAQTSQRMHGWGTGNARMMKRAIALDRRIERLKAAQPDRVRGEKALKGKFYTATRSGNDVLFIDNLTKRFGERTLFEGLELDIKKDESVALIGDNGSGKTTLLKILLGEEPPTSGFVRWGSNIKLAYLPQKVFFQNENLSLLDTVVAELKITEPMARNRLGQFHFSGEDVFKPVSALSGGEKSRLKLAIVMYNQINMLVLDEPTNHLDIASREWIEETLEQFDGTMLFVSHDRYFINRFATRVWSIEDGALVDFKGTYGEYRAYLERQAQLEQIRRATAANAGHSKRNLSSGSPARQRKNTERKLREAEKNIAEAEECIRAIEAEMENNPNDHELLTKLYNEETAEKERLDALYAQWERLSEELDGEGKGCKA